jgi:hypothetical protein
VTDLAFYHHSSALLLKTVRALNYVAGKPFVAAIIGPIAAAFFGTWGAQKLSEKIAHRNETIAQINAINFSIAWSSSILNTFISTKRQFILPLFLKFRDDEQKRGEQLKAKGPLQSLESQVRSLSVEIRTMNAPYSMINELKEVVSTKFYPSTMALMLLPILIQSIDSLTSLSQERNIFITEFRNKALSNEERLAIYFGEKLPNGQTDERNKNYINHLMTFTDDCIAYSLFLTKELQFTGLLLRTTLRNRAPKISSVDFASSSDDLPDLEKYPIFLRPSEHGNKQT